MEGYSSLPVAATQANIVKSRIMRTTSLDSRQRLLLERTGFGSPLGDCPMPHYQDLLRELTDLIGEDTNSQSVFRQARDAVKELLARQSGEEAPEEPTDHEAEGAMRYVMSRGHFSHAVTDKGRKT
jgi:hypothetical protein